MRKRVKSPLLAMAAASFLLFPAAARAQNNSPDGGAIDSLSGAIRQRMSAVDKGGAGTPGTAAAAAAAPAGNLSVDAAPRVGGRDYPSVFQAWSPADPLKWKVDPRHDLAFIGQSGMGLVWDKSGAGFDGLSVAFTPASVAKGLAQRRALLGVNPHLVLLMEVRYRDARAEFLPPGSPMWMGADKNRPDVGYLLGDMQYYKLDYSRDDVQSLAAAKCAAAVRSGVFDGCMLDWWQDQPDQVKILQKIRQAAGERALIIVNANNREVPQSAPYINGIYMEVTHRDDDIAVVTKTLEWAEGAVREPRINCLELWLYKSRQELDRMRLTTTIGLVHSDGYVLFGDPDGLAAPEHQHDWYPFWNKSLGHPGRRVPRSDGALQREYDKGTVISNPGAAPVTVTFPESRLSAATGLRSQTHSVPALDGDLFLR